MQWKDYYKTLGVARTADAAQIKKAYRALARQFHPDRNTSPAAEARFKEINEANEVLSDAVRRAEYDALGQDPERVVRERAAASSNPLRSDAPFYRSAPTGVRYEFHGVPADDFSDFFRVFFGDEINWEPEPEPPLPRPRPTSTPPASARPRPRNRSVEVSLVEVERGTTRLLRVFGKRLEVKIPPGVETGSKIRLSGAGGGAADIVLVIKVSEHPLFTRAGADLACEVPITLAEALLGAEVPLESLRGRLLVKIPPGVQPGQNLRLTGQGLPVLRGSRRGDLLVRIRVVLPAPLSGRARDAAVELAELVRQQDPRGR
jgi:curved DNA-binding protein